ncbi:MAG: CotH kinase family protein [Flavobacteriales bacterium]|nr:CotH kinase family protein [Flavobacteriales bacterium]
MARTHTFLRKLALTLLLLVPTAIEAQVVINEYSCSNRTVTDAFGNFEDWVELYNPSSQAVDLTGYHLSDKPTNPTKWQFPGGVVPAGGRLVVVCSGRDAMAGPTPHTNFRLGQLGPESIVFSDPLGNVLESYVLATTQSGHSRGRTSDGAATWGVFANPTRGTANSGAAAGYAGHAVLSQEAGVYSGSITVSMSADAPNTLIRYTTDGTEPTAASTQYSTPVNISTTTVLRARGFATIANVLPGLTETNTYLINVNHTVPVVSVAGDLLPDLLGGSQIEPVGSFEFFDAGGTLRDEAVGDFNKHGNDSWAYGQRGMDFIGRDEYGYNDEIGHGIFTTTERSKFKRLILKSGASDNYPFENGGAHIRDPYVHTLSQLGGLNLDERSSAFCVLYMNGSYWGIYDLREKVDDNDFTEYYYGQARRYNGSPEYVQFLKTWGGTWAEFGEQQALDDWATLRNFIENNNMGVPANFATATAELELESLVDYFILNSFIVNQDWLNWNTGWWRGLDPLGDMRRWRYILWDLDACFGHYINYTSIPDSSPDADPCNAENLPDPGGQGHTNIISKLINENGAAHDLYVTRQAALMNTVFSCSNMLTVLDSMAAVISPEMQRHTARWGGSLQGWQTNLQQMRGFIEARCVSVTEGVADCYELEGPFDLVVKAEPEEAGNVSMNGMWLPGLPVTTTVYGGILTDFDTEANAGFTFDHWELLNHSPTPGPGTNGITLSFTQGDTLTAVYKPAETDNRPLLYYWHFNTLNTVDGDVTAIDADYTLIADADPKMVYMGTGDRDIDSYAMGSLLNVQLAEPAGQAARVHNPSAERALVFNMPTTGHDNIVFRYVVHRSGSGMLNNNVSYSVNGTDFIQSGLTATSFSIAEQYAVITVEFTDIAAVNNNPDFHVRVQFEGNTDQINGNNRLDNITLQGNEIEGLGVDGPMDGRVSLYPNPFDDGFRIVADGAIRSIRILSMTGALVQQTAAAGATQVLVPTEGLAPGIYVVSIGTNKGLSHLRVVKR